MSLAPRAVRVELLGGDPFGVPDQPALSWWLPEDATVQTHYRIVTDDGYDTGRVESDRQVLVPVPVFTRSRRRTRVRVQVWTDAGSGESAWSDAIALDSGLLHESDWTARWIGPDEPASAAKGQRPAYWLRTPFDVDASGVVLLHATALGIYELFVNGVRVGDEELAPGYTQYARRVPYQTHDVSALLRPGRNTVAVLLADGWYRGQVGMPRAADQFGTHTAARVQIEAVLGDGPVAVLAATDSSWQAGRSHVLAADLIGGQREDRRLVHASEWAPAVLREVDVRIVRPVAPPVRRIEEIRPRSVTVVADGAAQIVDLGQNINGWVRLTDLGPAGTAITLRHGEHLDADGDLTTAHLDVNMPIIPEPLPVGQVDEVISAGVDGDRFEPRLTTHGFRYVRVEGHPLGADDVTGVVVHSDLRRTGWFSCSDARLNRLHDAVVWSLRDNMCAIPTDCPQRERAGWTGDWQLFAPTAAYLYDVLAFTRSWLRDVALDQRADGCVANMSPCPLAEGFDGPLGGLHGSAGWGDVVVSAPWDLYQVYADESLLAENWTVMRAWVDYAARCAAGARHPARAARGSEAAEHEKYLWDSGFHWGEWLEPDASIGDFHDFATADKSEVTTAYLHRSADTLARIAVLLGEDADTAAHYADIAAGARRAWQAEFVRPDGSLRVDSQASHVRALAFGLVPESLRPGVAARLVALIEQAGTHLGTGFLSTPLLLPALADAGHLDVAYALLLQDSEPSWLTMIDRGATTVWERWNGVDADGHAHESLNHYSKGAVISFLHRYVAGLRATSPGYRTFTVQPRPGGSLTAARARFESCYGPIEVDWLRDGSRFRLEVHVPAGTTASIVLPDGARRTAGSGRHTFCAPGVGHSTQR